MSNDVDKFLASLRARIESRVREQLVRHSRVDPTSDRKQIVELQMKQEREKLERLIEEHEENPAMSDAYQAILDWLPELERDIKRH